MNYDMLKQVVFSVTIYDLFVVVQMNRWKWGLWFWEGLTGMSPQQPCETCQAPATQSCSACGLVYYCSREHQKMDWSTHKKNCASYKILTNETLGRYMVATRDIKAGEIIIKKKPLIAGPKMLSLPMCLGCHKRLDFNNPPHPCSNCKWPLCSPLCEKSSIHRDECDLFTKTKYNPTIKYENLKQPVYALIVPLRALLMKQHQTDKYQTILTHQSHLKEHMKTPLYQALSKTLVNVIKMMLKVDASEEEILTLCSIFDTNMFEMRDTSGLINIRAIYPVVSFVSHCCKHNTKHVFRDDDQQLTLIATMPIKKDELITTTYTQTLWGTLTRRAHLKEAKLFDCICDRCKDPTEFGTYAGSFYCRECNDKASKMLPCDPLNPESVWECEKCGSELEASEIITMNDFLKREITQLDKSDPAYLEQFLMKYEHVLPPKNYHALEIKYALFQMYDTDLPESLLERKLQLCQELLDVADILEPGLSRFRGTILHELQSVLFVKKDRDLRKKSINKTEHQEKAQECEKILNESLEALKLEPDYESFCGTHADI